MNVKLSEQHKIHILNSEDIFKIMQQVLLRENKIRRSQEHFWIVGLNQKSKLLFIELIALGAVNRIQVNPPDVFRMAIYKQAVSVVLVHNHPSGEAAPPSEKDTDLTDRLLKVGSIINIKVIDHLIITEREYYSYEDAGLIQQLQRNGRYELMDKDSDEIRRFKLSLEKQQAKKEEKKNVARKMIKDNLPFDVIAKYTALSIKEVERLAKEKPEQKKKGSKK